MKNKYFLCIKVNSSDIKSKVKSIVNAIKCENNQNFNNNLINEGEYHITLVLFYAEENEIDNIKTIIENTINKFTQFSDDPETSNKCLQFNLKGLVQLGDINIVAALQDDENKLILLKFINFIKDQLDYYTNHQIQLIDEKTWIPHMTLLKYMDSNNTNKIELKNDISKFLNYNKEYNNFPLGYQKTYSIDLIQSGLPRDSTGYYSIKFNLPFNN
ncbi:hypothetical protein DICPUDRAFT_78675 [Dictyostelium purpureum]|uniref:A-kinase anchor protein 7-like phosphoesterase domain-containing protein n=1 Tax=Dictyostelium purpureum TaxID=5786 RepID=F0ZK79_DICPU|nr:uncharacterized protein DICPUDRAFT_78675 [Dictyostelium purpureum]EGC35638.1 hypothetical protein DICPUDRAFT_78675 [Dictyostelium purpureum]|eukprot:XP_003287817.1 hypothetical protein DICPUDRAFT_78675 [Dictyostelium purpureum]